jgi:hypothetical protein
MADRPNRRATRFTQNDRRPAPPTAAQAWSNAATVSCDHSSGLYACWTWHGRRWVSDVAFVQLGDAILYKQKHGGVVLPVSEQPPLCQP